MNKNDYGKTKRRTVLVVLVTFLVFLIFVVQLFQVQIVEGEEYRKIAKNQTVINAPVTAFRGEILDRNLKPMAINRTSYEIVFDYAFFPHRENEKKSKVQNDIILSLISLLQDNEKEWEDDLPITKTEPYEWVTDETSEKRIDLLKERNKMADYATPEHCISALVELYELEDYTPEEQRLVAGVRYKLQHSDFSYAKSYVFAPDVDENIYNSILENSNFYKGVNVQTVAIRKYLNGEIAAHLRGTVGKIHEETYEEFYKPKEYKLDDLVGQSGVEAAFEDILRGTNGESTIVKDSTGEIISKEITTPAISGDTVILTLDSELQLKVQNILDSNIKSFKTTSGSKTGRDIKSASAVVIDVKTGGVLTAATWPNYDLNDFNKLYDELIENPDNPLLNRALQGTYPIGSTMKPGVALAALNEGKYTPTSAPIFCNQKYYISETEYIGCLGYHGNVSMLNALANSCNSYFANAGKVLGPSVMNDYLSKLGLGQKTGIELEKEEAQGGLASPEFSEKLGVGWVSSDASQGAIGQSTTSVTPIQLATYAASIANKGIRYRTHFLQSVRHYNGSISMTEPEILSDANLSDTAINTVHQGMQLVSKSGTARGEFSNYRINVATKTGTAQNPGPDHGTFIAYAPAENPEIAVGVITENGASVSSIKIARQVIDAYLDLKTGTKPPAEDGILLK